MHPSNSKSFARATCNDPNRGLTLAGAAIAMCTTLPAGAATVKFVDWNVSGTHPVVNVSAPNVGNAQAGEFRVLIDGNPATSFCIELTQHISLPSSVYTDYTLVSGTLPFNTTQLGRFSRLYEHYLDDARQNATSSGAFQVAVWEIAYDGAATLDLLVGAFDLTGLGGAGSAANIANNWLATLDAQSSAAWTFEAMISANRQDQLLGREGPANFRQISLPGTAALMSAGLAGFTLRRVRSRSAGPR